MENKKLCLIGDWTIDEHWITGIHTLPTSSRTGLFQRIIKNSDKQQVQYLSGAGRTASVLCKEKSLSITGIGVWAKKDSKALLSFFTDKILDKENNEFQLNWTFPSKGCPKNLVLKNIQDQSTSKNAALKTTRVIRIYTLEGGAVNQLERIDFEVPELRKKTASLIIELIKNEKLNLFENNNNNKESHSSDSIEKDEQKTIFEAIVIKDLNKGVVTRELIEKFKNEHSNSDTKWFISSKIWNPQWMEVLNDRDIELVIIPTVAAKAGLMKNDVLDPWMINNCNLSESTLKYLNSQKNINNLVILPEGTQVIAYSKTNKRRKNLFWQSEINDQNTELNLPFASVFFPELVKQMLKKSPNFLDGLKSALVSAVNWRTKRTKIIFSNSMKFDARKKFGDWYGSNIQDEFKLWKQAMDLGKTGILNKNRFELWRGSSILPQYICLNQGKKKQIARLINSLKRSPQEKMKRSEAILIFAQPGSGKSFLVKQISKEIQVDFKEFNLTNLQSKKDILDCFDEINSYQSLHRGRDLLIFFDEFDHEFGGNEYSFSSFLTVLEDGYYTRGNQRFQMEPAVWVFVGSKPEMFSPDQIQSFSKALDFLSRISYPILDLAKLDSNHEEREKLEKLYYSVAFIRQIFPNVSRISSGALMILSKIKRGVSVRDIRKFIESLKYVSYEKIDFEYLLGQIQWLNEQGDSRVVKLFGDQIVRFEDYDSDDFMVDLK